MRIEKIEVGWMSMKVVSLGVNVYIGCFEVMTVMYGMLKKARSKKKKKE
jgi:hypothetical protein